MSYLLGAGATQGAIAHAGGSTNQLMSGLATDLAYRMRVLVDTDYDSDQELMRLVNSIVDDEADFEQLVTFFDDAPSARLRKFGERLRMTFSDALRAKLHVVNDEIADRVCDLFAALVDMHMVVENPETLAGILTLNYDVFVERAILESVGQQVDYGLSTHPHVANGVRLLKLHGSFGWTDSWPLGFRLDHAGTNWIPPGIRKAKDRYPFNSLWGQARDVLDCDVLRIIGCNLGPNDWDLVSLIFGSKFGHDSRPPMEIEVIGSTSAAERISSRFPFLSVKSVLEIPDVGNSMIVELLGREASYVELTEAERRQVEGKIPPNGFQYWLIHKASAV